MMLTLVSTHKTFSGKNQVRVIWLAIYAVQKQSQAPCIHKGKDIPTRSCIKL